MYIENGIAYAGEKALPLKVCGIRPLPDYKLWLRFSNGESRIFDCKPLLSLPAFAPLIDVELFKTVYIDYGVPVWCDGDIDISPEEVYEKSVSEIVPA